ncbi:hypothetical protein ACWD3I_39945 [Streptomyces sp. NPDC002817]|uniref:hypothetical protein n=1 Tax=Streptomyces sp. NPDC088357 TaxID=3154655 RepID=UPI003437ED45
MRTANAAGAAPPPHHGPAAPRALTCRHHHAVQGVHARTHAPATPFTAPAAVRAGE